MLETVVIWMDMEQGRKEDGRGSGRKEDVRRTEGGRKEDGRRTVGGR